MIEACLFNFLSAGWFGRVLGHALFWTVSLLAVSSCFSWVVSLVL